MPDNFPTIPVSKKLKAFLEEKGGVEF